jgi:hypothetical protein
LYFILNLLWKDQSVKIWLYKNGMITHSLFRNLEKGQHVGECSYFCYNCNIYYRYTDLIYIYTILHSEIWSKNIFFIHVFMATYLTKLKNSNLTHLSLRSCGRPEQPGHQFVAIKYWTWNSNIIWNKLQMYAVLFSSWTFYLVVLVLSILLETTSHHILLRVGPSPDF